MSSILNAIEQQLESFHQQERKLADYILSFPGNVVNMGITELAEQSTTSAATVTRFCKSLHFRGFPDFKMRLAADLAQKDTSLEYHDLVEGNPLSSIVEAIEANHIRSIVDTTRLLDLSQLTQALDVIRDARTIDVYGMATSGIVAQDLSYKLSLIGKRARYSADSHLQIISATNLQAGDVAIAISHSGETKETIDALTCAKANGATTISLTKYGSSTISNMSDVQLFTSTLEAGMRRGDMASRIAQLHVIDILFAGIASERHSNYIPRIERSYEMVQKFRKDKGRI